MATIDLQTENYRLLLMRPDMVTDAWVQWANDRVLMRQINSKLRKTTRAHIQDYVLKATLDKRAIIGIFERATMAHVGVCEILFDQVHRNANLDILIDFKSHDLRRIMDEAIPALLQDLKSRFGAEKAVILAPQSYQSLVEYLNQSQWQKEGVLRAEFPHASENRRMDGLQYGRLI
jgi:hypothetical protein